jgi:hypothetical protein
LKAPGLLWGSSGEALGGSMEGLLEPLEGSRKFNDTLDMAKHAFTKKKQRYVS